MERIEVVCAIIQSEGRTLAVQRSDKMSHPLKWEFPGGKIERGETEQESLIRELKEELDIVIDPLERLRSSTHRYPKFEIELIPYLSTHISGEIKLTEHKEYRWFSDKELRLLDWAEADIPILNEYLEKRKKEVL